MSIEIKRVINSGIFAVKIVRMGSSLDYCWLL